MKGITNGIYTGGDTIIVPDYANATKIADSSWTTERTIGSDGFLHVTYGYTHTTPTGIFSGAISINGIYQKITLRIIGTSGGHVSDTVCFTIPVKAGVKVKGVNITGSTDPTFQIYLIPFLKMKI